MVTVIWVTNHLGDRLLSDKTFASQTEKINNVYKCEFQYENK